MMKNILGLMLGLVVGFGSVELYAQTKNITLGDGWNICVAVTNPGTSTFTITVDGVLQSNFIPSIVNNEVRFPVDSFFAPAKTFGQHNYVVTASDAIILADGSALSATKSDSYTLVDKNAVPGLGTPLLKRIFTTIMDLFR